MEKTQSIYSLKGRYKGEPYEEISKDVKYLQGLQTKILRTGGTGFIKRL